MTNEKRYDEFNPEKYYTTIEVGKLGGDTVVYKDVRPQEESEVVLYKCKQDRTPCIIHMKRPSEEQIIQRHIEQSDYKKAHCRCPKCGGDNLLATLVAYLDGKDMNETWCSCGWSGIGHDLIPEKHIESNGEIGELPLN